MNKEEAKKLAVYCAKLWPNQVTKELSVFAMEKFLPHDAKLARKGIEQHRSESSTNGFLDWGRLLTAIELAEKASDLRTTEVKQMSFADMQRQISPCYNGMNDVKVTLCVFRHEWRIALAKNPQGANLPENPTETQKQHAAAIASHRSRISNSCTMLLMTAGMDRESAPRWAEAVFEESVEYFRQCMEELSSWRPPAMNQVEEALAV